MYKFEVLIERIAKNVINELYNPEDMCKTDTEKAIEATSKNQMLTNNTQPNNIPPKKKKVLAANKNRDMFGI
jgi:hypothetical protein